MAEVVLDQLKLLTIGDSGAFNVVSLLGDDFL